MNSKQNGQHARQEDSAIKRKHLRRVVGAGIGALVAVAVAVSVLFVTTGGNPTSLIPIGFNGNNYQTDNDFAAKDAPEQNKDLPANDLAIAGQNPGGRNVAPGTTDTGGMGTPYPMENLVNAPLVFRATITDIETFEVVPLYEDPYDRCLITVNIDKVYFGDPTMVDQSRVIFCGFDGFVGSHTIGTLVALDAESVFFTSEISAQFSDYYARTSPLNYEYLKRADYALSSNIIHMLPYKNGVVAAPWDWKNTYPETAFDDIQAVKETFRGTVTRENTIPRGYVFYTEDDFIDALDMLRTLNPRTE